MDSRLGSSYSVEVSGWNEHDDFFVERTVLDLGLCDEKEVRLRYPVREGGVVFVRALQPFDESDRCPVACRVSHVSNENTGGKSRIQLEQLRPRAEWQDSNRHAEHKRVHVG
jgi:hypothetical protein